MPRRGALGGAHQITAIPELLRILELSGCIITCDAMGCQKTIAKEIIKADAHYVLALKGNHETAHKEISTYLLDLVIEKETPRAPNAAPAHEAALLLESLCEVEKDHGRITTRQYYQSDQIEWFEEKQEWEGLKTFGMEKTITEQRHI